MLPENLTSEPHPPQQYAEVTKSTTIISPIILTPTSPRRVEESLTLLKGKIDAAKLGIGVNNIKSRPSGLIAIFPETTSSRDILQKEIKRTLDREFSLKIGTRKSPHIIIHGLSNDLTPESALQKITAQNNTQIAPDEAKFLFKLKGRESNKMSMVFKVAPYLYQALTDRGRVNINWEVAKIKKFTPVIRCYRCQEHGHFAKTCEKEQTCGRCAGAHATRTCTGSTLACALCKLSPHHGESHTNHSALEAFKCPTIKYITKVLDDQTDFGK